MQTFAKRVLDESVDVVEIDVVIVIAKRLRPVSRRAASATSTVKVSADAKKETTVEYQRTKAKEMVKYFKEMQYQQLVEDSTVFGWTKKNEINNGRWTMFGLLVGMMTEYATGVDFIDQIKLLVNVLGIADLD